MLSVKAMRKQTGLGLVRYYTRSPPVFGPNREVMVSQSRDLARNIALEDWTVRNTDLTSRHIVILTNNLTLSPLQAPTVDIKATLLCQDVTANAVEFESMVLSSLPRSLALSSIPDLDRSHTFLSPGCVSHSVTLPLPQSVSAREVLTAIQSIAKTFLKEEGQRRMSLVRPDDGWFPGIEKIRADLADTIQQCSREVSNRSKEELRAPLGPTKGRNQGSDEGGEGSRGGWGLQNSFGV